MTESAPIIQFSGGPAVIVPGGCATFRWHVEGVRAVYFHAEGEPWQDHGVVGSGEQRVCPVQTTTYCLRVIKRDDSIEVHKMVVEVQAPHEDRVVRLFAADRLTIQAGEGVTFRWHVEGVREVYFFPEGGGWQGYGVAGVAEQQVFPSQTTTYRLRVVRQDGSVEVHKVAIQVQPKPEVIQEFTADRTEVRPGECVTFRWRVEGVKEVYFHAEEREWRDRGVTGTGEAQRSPGKTTTFCLRVVKRDDSLEIHRITIHVKG